MKKSVIIVYGKGTAEIFKRQSALGSYIHCLATILVKHGYTVSINKILFHEGLKQETEQVNSPLVSRSSLKKLIPAVVKDVIKDRVLFRSLATLYLEIEKNNKIDCILEFYSYGSNLGYLLSKKYNKPLFLIYDNPVLEEHNFFHTKQILFEKKIEGREKKSVLHASGIVAYSRAVKEYLNKKYSMHLPIFIHQNVDYTRFDFIDIKQESEEISIGFIGSFLKWHRVDLLINAFVRLRKEGISCKLYLLGNGMEFGNIKEIVNHCEYVHDIDIPGFVDGSRLLEYKRKIDVAVMPGSNWYGAPNKIFEYGAAKMAVVAPDTPTIKDLFSDKEELLFFKQDDENSLYEQLLVLCLDKHLRSSCATALQNKIRNNYSENITFTFYNQLLSSAIA